MQIQPVYIDLFALIMLLGVAQALLLGVFFLTGSRGKIISNRCIGWFMLGLSAITGEIFLCYTNYMFRLLAFVDFSEPLNFLLGPVFFFFVVSKIRRRLPKRWILHLVPLVIWTANAVTWLYQPIEFKYNSYLNSYHPELSFIDSDPYLPEDFTGLRDYIDELTLLSCLIYAALALLEVRNAFRRNSQTLWSTTPAQLVPLRNLSLMFLLFPLVIVAVKPQFHNDLGDYLIACYATITIYATSLLVMRGSDFFKEAPLTATTPEPRKKYEKSALSEEKEEAVMTGLTRLMISEKPYLEADLSLPKLAQRLNTSPHHLSQLLNDRLNQSFFDMLAAYRVQEAQQLLHDPATTNLKIDEIAERVGYNSTSAFHTAFKRITGQTPAQFRQGRTDGSVMSRGQGARG
ncbi:hypothetical protein GCM10023189_09480 [Nibrella saemangeumensis]|uniref:HTH araC/xylS-type domain-containing protein n=1 Tax=Nibrella saemangeumensis TaxID=1084526 RepID=A0ABP8MI30_9BACT